MTAEVDADMAACGDKPPSADDKDEFGLLSLRREHVSVPVLKAGFNVPNGLAVIGQ